ncbi:undecaprenyl-phosphate glucose phosphotransferase [Methylotenera sp. 73s]|uniref:undecaprenyl-phosphate glucose phosphotransferase n=1 Tax=Methylotenera sp. 73s TaxID=1165096 RepID=UPI00036836DC|nr:undecaprenyl-phosphate glucose phosphotransferase [Methylotenera sp. 73s]
MVIRSKSRSVLQRRRSLINILQPLLDGVAILGVAWFFIQLNVGYLTQDYIILLLVLLGLVSVMYDRFAIYRTSSSFVAKLFSLFNAWSISFLALFVLGFLTKQSHVYSRVFITELFLVGFIAQSIIHFFIRIVNRRINKHSHVTDNVIIVGQGQLANYLEHKITSNPWLNERVIGNVSIEEEIKRKRKAQKSELNDYPTSRTIHLGKVAELPDLIDEHDINTIYIVTPLESSRVLEELYFVLLDKHVTIHWIPDIFSLRLINHSVKEIAGIPVLTLSETPLTGVSKLGKAIEDKVLSFLILLLITPVLIVVAIVVKLDSPGPVFFRQDRTGWNGKTFSIWKFRSMRVNQQVANNQPLEQAKKNDSRITKVGAFIRKTSLDELPQVFNVLKGDMSLVGPRPHAVQHDEVYSRRISDYYARHNIKPGITGLAQVRGYRGETKEIDQMTKRIESDIEYINNWSIWLDLSILMRTVTAFTGKGAY